MNCGLEVICAPFAGVLSRTRWKVTGESAETYQPDCPRASALQTGPRFVGNVTPKSPNRCKQHAELMERIKMSKKIVSARRPSQHARSVRYPFGAREATRLRRAYGRA